MYILLIVGPRVFRELTKEVGISMVPDLRALRHRSDKREVRGSTTRWPMTTKNYAPLEVATSGGAFRFSQSSHGIAFRLNGATMTVTT